MRGGDLFDDSVVSIFMALIIFVVITTINRPDEENLIKILEQAASEPEKVVSDIFSNHKQEVLQAGEQIANRVHGDLIQKDNMNKTIDQIFEGEKSNEYVLTSAKDVAADALDDIDFGVAYVAEEEELNSGLVEPSSGAVTARTSPKVGIFLQKYIDNYLDAVNQKKGGSKTKRRNRTKRRRRGSKKQQVKKIRHAL